VEEVAAALPLAAIVAIPLLEIVLRGVFHVGIPGAIPFVQHLTLWAGFLGAALAAREGRLLALSASTFLPEGALRRVAELLSGTAGAFVAALLCRAGVTLVLAEREAGTRIAAGVPVWAAQLVLPAAFAILAGRLAWRAGSRWPGRLLAGAAALCGFAFAEGLLEGRPAWPGLLLLVLAAAAGAPIFALLGGAAAFLFLSDGVRPVAVLIETYQLSVKPTLPSIPLFTLAGFLLAEGRAPQRLLRCFRGLVGSVPGGTAVVAAAVCAFFTVFTGGSGVTILALGGLLLPALIQDGYGERFSVGLLTASGSLGLLLPPALPLILYAIVAEIAPEELFVGGLLPGLLLVGLAAGWGVREGIRRRIPRPAFDAREAVAAVWGAKWEILLPVIVLVAIFGGFATLVEASALAALYAFLVQRFVHRDLASARDLGRVLTDCGATIGGVLLVLGVAVGLTGYLVQADVPGKLLQWTQATVGSRWVFLLALNVFLLIVGCLMDIFSAIFVVVPLIVPLGEAYGVHPIHLGVLFVANLELGYLTPPVGLNLFLASYRFKRPLLEVAAATLPMLAILGAGVLLITYVPWLTTGLLVRFGHG